MLKRLVNAQLTRHLVLYWERRPVGMLIAGMSEADRARNWTWDEFVERMNFGTFQDLKEVITLGYLGQWTGRRIHYAWLTSGICEYYASGLKDTKF